MRITPILEMEKARESIEDFTKIFLHKEGKFYRLFEVSAFLVKNYVCTEDFQKQRGDKSILQSPRYQTNNDEYVIAGFPVESFSKYIPNYVDAQKGENDDVIVTIDAALFGEDISVETLQTAFEDWKMACPLKGRNKSRSEVASGASQQAALGRSGIFSIVSEILAYPVEASTPAQNIEFISKMKGKLVQLL